MTLKEKKEMEDSFKKAQKPWVKILNKVDKCKLDYHNACKAERSASNQERNATGDNAVSPEQVSLKFLFKARAVRFGCVCSWPSSFDTLCCWPLRTKGAKWDRERGKVSQKRSRKSSCYCRMYRIGHGNRCWFDCLQRRSFVFFFFFSVSLLFDSCWRLVQMVNTVGVICFCCWLSFSFGLSGNFGSSGSAGRKQAREREELVFMMFVLLAIDLEWCPLFILFFPSLFDRDMLRLFVFSSVLGP